LAGALEHYVLGASGKRRPRVCYIPTASSDPARGMRRFKRAFGALACEPATLDLFDPTRSPDVEDFLLAQDVVWVGGGNTRNMLLLWRAWGVDRALRAAYENGTVLAGVSAGALCWFEGGVTDSYPRTYAPLRCLGWLAGSFTPHYNSEPTRRPLYRDLIARGKLAGGYAADDFVALHFRGGRLHEAVTTQEGAAAYRVTRTASGVREQRIAPRLLRG
jgi:peptidase E